MKLYSEYPQASIQMSEDPHLIKELKTLATADCIHYIFESGTYLGTGSTSFIANTFKNCKNLKQFFTLEINPDFFLQAKKNLAQFSFVRCIYGLSVKYDEAIAFIKTDDAILNHHQYSDVFIDDIINPQKFYLNEIEGFLSRKKLGLRRLLLRKREDVIQETLAPLKGTPLIVLDSAGGIGYLEFQKVLKIMRSKKEFYLLLDDVHHLKHFRSKLDVEADEKFKILAKSLDNGWLLAHHAKS